MFCTVSMGDPWHSYVGSTSVLPDKNTANYIIGGADTTATTWITGSLVFGTSYFIHVRATTGTYLSVPATSDTITVRSMILKCVSREVQQY